MITKEILKKIAPYANDKIIADLEKYFDVYLNKYNINTFNRVCHFLAQAAHESAGFRTLEEYASGADYEGRKDLGNVNPGDGKRYKGRGIFQITGRANYKTYGDKLNVDLVDNPPLAADGRISVLTACEFWNNRNLSTFADIDDITSITRRINGGLNGLDDRKNYLARAKKVIPPDVFHQVNSIPAPAPVVEVVKEPDPQMSLDFNAPIQKEEPVNIEVAKKGDNSPYVKDLQNMLIKKGAKITADGSFGPATEKAVKAFQKKVGLNSTGTIDTNTLNKLMEA